MGLTVEGASIDDDESPDPHFLLKFLAVKQDLDAVGQEAVAYVLLADLGGFWELTEDSEHVEQEVLLFVVKGLVVNHLGHVVDKEDEVREVFY